MENKELLETVEAKTLVALNNIEIEFGFKWLEVGGPLLYTDSEKANEAFGLVFDAIKQAKKMMIAEIKNMKQGA